MIKPLHAPATPRRILIVDDEPLMIGAVARTLRREGWQVATAGGPTAALTELANAVPDVLFERHAEGRPTWLTTAMTREAMAERYGDGLARRVYEGAKIIDCGVGS